MKRRILKFQIKTYGETTIEVSGIGKILYVGVQRGNPFVWVEVNEYILQKETKRIRVFHTGEDIPEELHNKTKYIGTFLLDEGCYVGHAYQIL